MVADKEKSRKEWMNLQRNDLILKCTEYSLDVTGNKPELANRLITYFFEINASKDKDAGSIVSDENNRTESDDLMTSDDIPDPLSLSNGNSNNNDNDNTNDDSNNNVNNINNNDSNGNNNNFVDQVKDVIDNMRVELEQQLQKMDSAQKENNTETKALRSELRNVKQQLNTGGITRTSRTTIPISDDESTSSNTAGCNYFVCGVPRSPAESRGVPQSPVGSRGVPRSPAE